MADESALFGAWELIGDERYIADETQPAVRYRWRAPEKLGAFEADFQCVAAGAGRLFYPAEVLSSLREGGAASAYAERVCRAGIPLVPALEESNRALVGGAGGAAYANPAEAAAYARKRDVTQEALEFLLALFENRSAGHAHVKKNFARADCFLDTRRSRRRPDCLVPGLELSPRECRSGGPEVIRRIQELSLPAARAGAAPRGTETCLSAYSTRTPLDQMLVQGVYRDGGPGALSFREIIEAVAPAVINGIRVGDDCAFAAEHEPEFAHFLARLGRRYLGGPSRFGGWLRQESGKSFHRLLPEFKGLTDAERESAREMGRRFYRLALWTAYEAMSRCYGAASLWMAASLDQSEVVSPSAAELLAFRRLNAPLVCAGGMPLWFFGPNALSWVLGPYAERVWGHADQDFDGFTTLIAQYGHAATARRGIDADKKRASKTAGTGGREAAAREGSDGKVAGARVREVRPEAAQDILAITAPDYAESRACPKCGGRMDPARDEASGEVVRQAGDDNSLVVLIECVDCCEQRRFTVRT